MKNFENMDRERDLFTNRTVILDNGTKLFIRQDDQYGFWKIHAEKGRVADVISGNYTNFSEALRALNTYATNVIKKPIKEVQRGFGITTDGNNNLIEA